MQSFRIKIIIFLSLAGFFLGLMALTCHHHDRTFFPPGCSLCKAKISFAGTFSKVKADTVQPVLFLGLSSAGIFLSLSGILPVPQTVFIDRRIVETYPNKAPPLGF